MKQIPLTQGRFALVDDEDYDWLSRKKWHVTAQGYAGTSLTLGRINGKKVSMIILMHRIIAMTPSGMHTDHLNGCKTDNRRINLRVCTSKQNSYNRTTPPISTSGYHGVSWWPRDNNWTSHITVDRKNIRLGYFDTKEQAALIYNHFAQLHRGEFAHLNVIPSELMSKEEQTTFLHHWLASRGYRKSKVGLRGVYQAGKDRWRVAIKKGGKTYHLGVFNNTKDAARMYNNKAVELYGDRAHLNPI